MLIVTKQDEIDNLYAIWNTVTDRFEGVNLSEARAIAIIQDVKGCSWADAESRCKHPQPFSDIARIIDN